MVKLSDDLSIDISAGEGQGTTPQQNLLWRAIDGILIAEIGVCRLTVERLLPSTEARFVVWRLTDPPQAQSSGMRPSVKAAIIAAEEVAAKLSGSIAPSTD